MRWKWVSVVVASSATWRKIDRTRAAVREC
jgi:hypothetical protein